jgi:hypothetical protein
VRYIRNPASGAERKYVEFHSLNPKRRGTFRKGFCIPSQVACLGIADFVLYRSDKVDPATGTAPNKPVDYIHHHKKGVKVYEPGEGRRVPKWLRESKTLVLLGDCLGFGLETPEGDALEARVTRPYPELYTVPNGRALLVVSQKRRVEALIWGGKLGVEARGIVG